MWTGLSELARVQLLGSHTMTARVDVLHGGRPVLSLSPTAGEVYAEAGRSVARNMRCTLADPTGELAGGDIGDIMSAYDCELAPYRGVVTSAGVEWAPLGVFQITARTVEPGEVSVAAQDRAIKYQVPMTGSLAIPGATPVEMAIARLLATSNSALVFDTYVSGRTVGPLLYPPDTDVWRAAQELAQSIGCWLYHDRTGYLVLAPSLPTSSHPVARYAYGDGLLEEMDKEEDADTIRNVVVAVSSKTATGAVIRAVAADTDPTSPTYAGGRYGSRPITITNQHIGSVEQAQQVATTELTRQLGRSETVSFTAAPNIALDPLDLVTVHNPAQQLFDRGVVVESLTVPLVASSFMAVTCRKTLISADGRILDFSLAEFAA